MTYHPKGLSYDEVRIIALALREARSSHLFNYRETDDKSDHLLCEEMAKKWLERLKMEEIKKVVDEYTFDYLT